LSSVVAAPGAVAESAGGVRHQVVAFAVMLALLVAAPYFVRSSWRRRTSSIRSS
jgi:hypothetical protein